MTVSEPVSTIVVSPTANTAAPGVVAKVNFGTTESSGVPYMIESGLYTNPVSNRSSILNTAFSMPGNESLAAKENADSSATEDFVVVVVDLLQPTIMHTNKRPISVDISKKRLILCFFFTNFVLHLHICK